MTAMIAITISGCLTEVRDPFDTIVLETDLAPVGDSPVTGRAAIVSDRHTTEAGVGIRGLTLNEVVMWRIHESGCSRLGEAILGVPDHYPDLVGDDEGEAQAEAFLNVPIQRQADYSVVVSRLDDGGQSSVILACGSFGDFN